MAAYEARIVSVILIIEACVAMVMNVIQFFRAFQVPTLISWKFSKMNLTEFEKKMFLFVAVPGPVVVMILGVFFRESFGFKMHYSGMVILMEILSTISVLTTIFTLSSGINLYRAESPKFNNSPRSPSAKMGFKSPTPTAGGAQPRATFLMCEKFEWIAILLAFGFAIATVVLQLNQNMFVYQALSFTFIGMFIIAAATSMFYIWKRVRETKGIAAQREAANGFASSSSGHRFARYQALEKLVAGYAFAFCSVLIANVAMLVMLSYTSGMSTEDVWSPQGYKLTIVPEFNILLISSSLLFVCPMAFYVAKKQKIEGSDGAQAGGSGDSGQPVAVPIAVISE
jgi:hypothetical protein